MVLRAGFHGRAGFFPLLISCSIAHPKTHPLHVLENSHQQRPDNRHRPRHPAPTRTLQVLLGEGKHLLPKASLFPPSPCVIPPSRPRTPAAPAADAPAAATPLATRAASVRRTTRWYAAPAAKAWCPLPLAAPSLHHSPAATAPRWAPAAAAQSAATPPRDRALDNLQRANRFTARLLLPSRESRARGSRAITRAAERPSRWIPRSPRCSSRRIECCRGESDAVAADSLRQRGRRGRGAASRAAEYGAAWPRSCGRRGERVGEGGGEGE